MRCPLCLDETEPESGGVCRGCSDSLRLSDARRVAVERLAFVQERAAKVMAANPFTLRRLRRIAALTGRMVG